MSGVNDYSVHPEHHGSPCIFNVLKVLIAPCSCTLFVPAAMQPAAIDIYFFSVNIPVMEIQLLRSDAMHRLFNASLNTSWQVVYKCQLFIDKNSPPHPCTAELSYARKSFPPMREIFLKFSLYSRPTSKGFRVRIALHFSVASVHRLSSAS